MALLVSPSAARKASSALLITSTMALPIQVVSNIRSVIIFLTITSAPASIIPALAGAKKAFCGGELRGGDMEDLIKLTAQEAIALLKARKVSPAELLDASERRIRETDGAINALPTLCFDRARAHAEALAKERPEDREGPHLHGLPLAIKDLTPVKDVRFTLGSPIFKDQIASFSDVMVELLEERGGIVVGKSSPRELAAGGRRSTRCSGRQQTRGIPAGRRAAPRAARRRRWQAGRSGSRKAAILVAASARRP